MSNDFKIKATDILSVVGAAVTFGILLKAGGSKILFSGFTLWALLPYFLFSALARASTVKFYRLLVLALASLSVIVGIGFYIDANFIHLDAQGALVFLFVPLYQLIAALGVLAVGGVAKIVQRASRKKASA